ncbi:MAG: sulfate ABC transporter permease subunit CysT [Chthoniobacterales bacterium]|nr:sulfate ABC transporter permease subunit CysT [Chthoniobacterales bacterium]
MSNKRQRILPGFHLTLGICLTYLTLLVFIPLSTIFIRSSGLGWESFWRAITSPQVIASYKVTFGISFLASLTNAFFGFIAAWVLSRYRFPGHGFFDSIVDLPFALPTAVAGISLTALYSQNGWIGQFLYPLGIKSAYSLIGIYIALTFVGFPFVVRTLQPVIEGLDREIEEAGASLGASRWKVFWKIVFPSLLPALFTGYALAFARAIGEYGSVIFISGNMPMRTEITPLVIVKFLENYQYQQATAVACVMLVISFLILLIINALQHWSVLIGQAKN